MAGDNRKGHNHENSHRHFTFNNQVEGEAHNKFTSEPSTLNRQPYNLPHPTRDEKGLNDRKNWFGTYRNSDSFSFPLSINRQPHNEMPSESPTPAAERGNRSKAKNKTLGRHSGSNTASNRSPATMRSNIGPGGRFGDGFLDGKTTIPPHPSRPGSSRRPSSQPRSSSSQLPSSSRLVRPFNEIAGSDDELAIISPAEFKAAKQLKQGRASKKLKPNNVPALAEMTVVNKASEDTQNGTDAFESKNAMAVSGLQVHDDDKDEEYDDNKNEEFPFGSRAHTPADWVPGSDDDRWQEQLEAHPDGLPPRTPDAEVLDYVYSSDYQVTPPTPGEPGSRQRFEEKIRARRVQKAKLAQDHTESQSQSQSQDVSSPTRKGASATASPRDDLSKFPDHVMKDSDPQESTAESPPLRANSIVPDIAAQTDYEGHSTPIPFDTNDSETSANPATQTEQAISLPDRESGTPPSIYHSTSPGHEASPTSKERKHVSFSEGPNTIPKVDQPEESFNEPEVATEATDISTLLGTPEHMPDKIYSGTIIVRPSSPATGSIEHQLIVADDGDISDLTDLPSPAISDLVQNEEVVSTEQSSSVSASFHELEEHELREAYEKAKKADVKYFDYVLALFDILPPGFYEELNAEEYVQVSLNASSSWTRLYYRDRKKNVAAEPDPSAMELAQDLSQIEHLLIDMWGAVESIIVVYYAEFSKDFTKNVLQEQSRRWQQQIFTKYNQLYPLFIKICHWFDSYFDMVNIKKRSKRGSTANPYARLFEKANISGKPLYASRTYLKALQRACEQAQNVYDIACMRRFKKVVGMDRKVVGKKYVKCVGALRKFNTLVMQRDWHVEGEPRNEKSPTPEENIDAENSNIESNGVTEAENVPDEMNIDEENIVVGKGSIGVEHSVADKSASKARGSRVSARHSVRSCSNYLAVQAARPRRFAQPSTPGKDADDEMVDEPPESSPDSMKVEVSEVRDEDDGDWPARGPTLRREDLGGHKRKSLQIDVSSSVVGGSIDEYVETP